MLKIDCSGLAPKECVELRTVLSEQKGLDVKLVGDEAGRAENRGFPVFRAGLPHFWLLVTTAAAASPVATAGKAFLDEAAKDAYKTLKDWMAKKFPKSGDSIKVTLYDAN